MKNSNFDLVLYGIVGVLVFCGWVGCINYQYKIYKKKYGDQMTWTDFMLDQK